MSKPNICVLRTDGTNCDEETAHAFRKAGGEPILVHINQLRSRSVRFSDFQLLAIPGGFSYGDDVCSGRILANELVSFLGNELREFIAKGKPIIGICNGFQVLVRAGLLPQIRLGEQHATLTHNTSGRFECRWVKLITDSSCVFTEGMEGEYEFQVAHGEGRFVASPEVMTEIAEKRLVVFRYSREGKATMDFPENPNGSPDSIAGVCDETRLVFGMMPHPERHVEEKQHPNWRRLRSGSKPIPHGLKIFENAVRAASRI